MKTNEFDSYGKTFLKDFFSTYREPKTAYNHFIKAFVKPTLFENQLNEIEETIFSVNGKQKVLLIDGHPRIGKTWLIIAVLASIADKIKDKEAIWSSGCDSLKIGEYKSDLKTTLDKLLEELGKINTNRLKVILLDDILGTFSPRPIKKYRNEELKKFFTWDKKNPLLKLLPSDCTIIVTGRSLFFLIAESILRTNIRFAENNDETKVKTLRLGLFRDQEGMLEGIFDVETLREVRKKNICHHPLSDDEDYTYLVFSTPLLAFDEKANIPEEQKYLAAQALFGNDLDTLCESAKTIGWPDDTLKILETAYVVTIAPGLLYLGSNAYKVLGLGEDAKELAKSMHYSGDKLRSGRLPNELYMSALKQHLHENLDDALRIFKKILSRGDLKDKSHSRIALGIGLRGFIESSLCPETSWKLDKLMNIKEFDALFNMYQNNGNQGEDFLLNLELHHHQKKKYSLLSEKVNELNPGLVSSVGWVLYRFIQYDEEEHGLEVLEESIEWFQKHLKKVIDEFPLSLYNQEKWDTITSFYSTFLYWGFKIGKKSIAKKIIDTISNSDFAPEISKRLQIILDDELIWAIMAFELDIELKESKILTDWSSFIKETSIEIDTNKIIEKRIVNIYFTLVWHNEWMVSKEMKQKLSKFFEPMDWVNRNQNRVDDLVSQYHDILDDNMQYHWCHFITQRATWMRDWCFHDDPNKFEREVSQISKGANSNDNAINIKFNNYLENLLFQILKKVHTPDKNSFQRVRNILMFIGTRTSRMNYQRIIDKILELVKDDVISISPILEAIFELGRQEYLEKWNKNTDDDFREQCKKIILKYLNAIENTWKTYWREIARVTYSLDLKPREINGWQDVLPIEWVEEIQLKIEEEKK